MKLLICTSEYPPMGGGISNVVFECVKRLKSRGLDCKVCSPVGPDIQIGSINLIKKFGRIGLLYYWYQVSRNLNNFGKFDAIWLHQPLLIRKTYFPRVLVTMHISAIGVSRSLSSSQAYPFALKFYKRLAGLLEEHCLNNISSKKLIYSTDNKQVYTHLQSKIPSKIAVTYVPNGVDNHLFKPESDKNKIRQKFNLPLGKRIILSVGRLNRIKNPMQLVKVFASIEKKTEDVYLVIVGDGSLRKDIERLVKRIGIKKVILLGNIAHGAIHEVFACSDYFIMASIYDAQPLSLLEAMSSGLPCIVSTAPGLGIVSDSKAGIIVEFEDISIAAKNIINFINNSKSTMYGENARHYSCTNFNWDIVVNKYINLFTEICER